MAENVPMPQKLQAVCAALGMEPTSQSEHVPLPSWEYVPVAQGSQVSEVEKVPPLQALQRD
jgi:hypothetical protein